MTPDHRRAVRIDQNVWIRRPATQVFDGVTNPDVLTRCGAGIAAVRDLGGGVRSWRMRSTVFPRSWTTQTTRWEPGRLVELESTDGDLSARVTFVPVDAETTAVTVHASYDVNTVTHRLLAAVGVPAGCVQRTLVRLKHAIEAQPVEPERVVPGGRERPTDPGQESGGPAVGVPRELGYQARDRRSGSPGGAGTMGASSDDVSGGGMVGPAGIAGVPRRSGQE